jgi:hypothetical protein
MRNVASKVVSVVLVLTLVLALTACGDLFTTVDYPSISNLEQSLGVNGNPEGKTVKVTAEKVMSDGASGYIVQQGKFNFCLSSDPGMVPGNTATFKITRVTRQTDAIYVYCTKV